MYFGKCKKCDTQVGFLNLKKGLCSQCNIKRLERNLNIFLSKQPFIFKDNKSAFEYACKTKDCTVYEGANIPGLVVQVIKLETENDGYQRVSLKVASDDNGFLTIANTIARDMPKLKKGDFVAWKAVTHMKNHMNETEVREIMIETGVEPKFFWWGVIIGILKPELTDKGWSSEALWIDPNEKISLD